MRFTAHVTDRATGAPVVSFSCRALMPVLAALQSQGVEWREDVRVTLVREA